MKKLVLICGLILALGVMAALSFAQGDPELTRNQNLQVHGFAPKSITNYTHTKAAITIPLATNVTAYCLQSTAAGTVQFNGTGGTKIVAAATDYCRTVRKGITSIVFTGPSSASKTIALEKQY